VLQIERGHVDESAKKLGLSRSAFYKKIKRYGIDLSRVSNMSLASETYLSSALGNGIHNLSK